MELIPKRITLTASLGFDAETSRRLRELAQREGVDPRVLAARLLHDALAALPEVGEGDAEAFLDADKRR